MKLGLRIIIIIALQTAALVVMVGMKQYTLSTGVPIVVKTEPIDPRSLFSGDYVRLNYTISQLPIDKLDGDKEFERNDDIYVVVRQEGEFWEAISVYRAMPSVLSGQVVIKGRVEYVSDRNWRARGQTPERVKTINVKYGVENYYVPEGEGRVLERPKPDETLSIRLVVDKNGNAAIKAVLVNGTERYVEKVF